MVSTKTCLTRAYENNDFRELFVMTATTTNSTNNNTPFNLQNSVHFGIAAKAIDDIINGRLSNGIKNNNNDFLGKIVLLASTY